MKPPPGLTAAFGPMRRLTSVRFPLLPATAQARRRAGCGRGSDGLPSLREGALRCSASWPVAELTSLAALSAFKQAATSMFTRRAARAARNPALLGGADSPRPRPARCLAGHWVGLRSRPATAASRPEGGAAPGRLCAAEKRRACGRARSALRDLTRRRCLSVESAANAASSATGPQGRASQGTRSAAKGQHSESRRRTALGPAPSARLWTLNACIGPTALSATAARFMHRGSREARWSN